MGRRIFLLIVITSLVWGGDWLYRAYEVKESEIPTSKISDLKVILYSKEICAYCQSAKNLLDKKGINYEVVELTNNKDLHIKLINQTGQSTVPYVFINDKFIGGYQNLLELDEAKGLECSD